MSMALPPPPPPHPPSHTADRLCVCGVVGVLRRSWCGQDGATALLLAVRGSHDAIVKALVAAGADGTVPLYDACSRGDTAIVKVLLSAPGMNPNVVQPVRVFVGQHVCVQARACEGVRACVGEGSPPLSECHSAVCVCVLVCLCVCGLVPVVRQSGATSLLVAVQGSHDTIVKALLGAGANVNAAGRVR